MTSCAIMVYMPQIPKGFFKRFENIIEEILKTDMEFNFYVSGIGEFDKACIEVLKQLRKKYSFFEIRIKLVISHIEKNTDCGIFYEDGLYDLIVVPPNYKSLSCEDAERNRNIWMLKNSFIIIAPSGDDSGIEEYIHMAESLCRTVYLI